VTARHPGEIFFSLYGLTGGELRVLLALLEGLTAGEAAVRFGISSSTVKTHLQRLFEKTGTSRQAELVSTVLGVLPPLRNA
jgi:DNA-binding CsgD family transcriptional regulator